MRPAPVRFCRSPCLRMTRVQAERFERFSYPEPQRNWLTSRARIGNFQC